MTSAIGSYATAGALKELIGTTDGDDDALVATICDRVNAWIESITLQPICPIASDTYTYDGDGLTNVWLPMPLDAPTKGIGGARVITLLEVAPYTGGTFETVSAANYMLRSRHGVIGPYRWLRLSDRMSTPTHRTFREGRGNVRITMTAGWDAIPDDLINTALTIAHRLWNSRESGNQVAGGEESTQSVTAFASADDKRLVRSYKARPIP